MSNKSLLRKFIVNPSSGGGRAGKQIESVRQFFEKQTGVFDYSLGKNRDDLSRLTREALIEGYDQIVAMGGDGTVNAVVQGFFSTTGEPTVRDRPVSLAVAPLGSGSDFYKTITAESSTKDWSEIVLHGEPREVDLGLVKLQTSEGSKSIYFINMAGVGMSAAIVRSKELLPRWIPRAFSYAVPTIEQVFKYKPSTAMVQFGVDSPQELKLLAAFISKGIYAGGGMKFGGGVSRDDGLFDVKLVRGTSLSTALRDLPKLYTGGMSKSNLVSTVRVSSVKIQSPERIEVELDGELLGSTDLEIQICQRALRVYFPGTGMTDR